MAELRNIPNGVVLVDNTTVTAVEYSTVFEIACMSGFILEGNGTVVCQDMGSWSDLPECIGKLVHLLSPETKFPADVLEIIMI